MAIQPAPIALLITCLLAATSTALGLFFYFEYYNVSGEWDLPGLFIVVVVGVIINIFLLVSSSAKNTSCLSLLPCFMVLECIALGLSAAWIVVSYLQSINQLLYCNTPEVDRLTCVALLGNTYCGAEVHKECARLKTGFVLIIAGLGVLLLSQVLSLIVSLQRRSQLLKEEYAYAELITDEYPESDYNNRNNGNSHSNNGNRHSNSNGYSNGDGHSDGNGRSNGNGHSNGNGVHSYDHNHTVN